MIGYVIQETKTSKYGETKLNYENSCKEKMLNENTFCTLDYPKPIFEDDSNLINRSEKKSRRRINLRKE